MPGGSGIDVLKGLQRDQMHPLVIVLTSYGESQYRKRCMELGATFFFAKTTEFEKVAEVLREMVASKVRRGFPLPDAQTPGQAMKELYPSFQEHVRQEHPDAVDPPAVPPASDGLELFDLPATGAGCGPGMDAGKAN
jgi:DNA-binding NarL/FixJ family response regulator